MKDTLFKSVLQSIQPPDKTLVAVSGGVDSVVLTFLFYELRLNFAIAHCNFGLRAAESDQDEAFVRHLAKKYTVPLHVKHFLPTDFKPQKSSVQTTARHLRYEWFHTLCSTNNFTKIVTAHHLNDCLETSLLNLFRGTGIAGLTNMAHTNPQATIIRPLLSITKQEIIKFAQENNLPWREDSSNAKSCYKRNIVRNETIPTLKKINPNLEATFATSLGRIHQAQLLCIEQVKDFYRKCVYTHHREHHISIQEIKHKPWAPIILYEIVKSFGFSYTEVQNFIKTCNKSGANILSKTHTLYNDRQKLWIISPRTSKEQDRYPKIFPDTTSLNLIDSQITFKTIHIQKYKLNKTPEIAALDIDLLKFPLTVRHWQPGDYFFPLGMAGKKKLSDFFVDQKFPIPKKQNTKVLISHNQIVWIIGHRIDDRYKITDNTKNIYEIKVASHNNN